LQVPLCLHSSQARLSGDRPCSHSLTNPGTDCPQVYLNNLHHSHFCFVGSFKFKSHAQIGLTSGLMRIYFEYCVVFSQILWFGAFAKHLAAKCLNKKNSVKARVFTDWDNECGKSVATDDSAVVHDVLRHNFNEFAVGIPIPLLKLLALSQGTRSVEHSGSCSEVFSVYALSPVCWLCRY